MSKDDIFVLTSRLSSTINLSFVWGRSSVGRAPQWHCGGLGFDSPRLHHTKPINLSDQDSSLIPDMWSHGQSLAHVWEDWKKLHLTSTQSVKACIELFLHHKQSTSSHSYCRNSSGFPAVLTCSWTQRILSVRSPQKDGGGLWMPWAQETLPE